MDSKLYSITRTVVMLTALVQLALSQIHIEMITQLFTREVGFYLFLFIILGLLILFNLTSMASGGNGRLGMFLATTIGTLISGVVFINLSYNDYLVQESVSFDMIQTSLTFIIISMAIYAIGGAIIAFKCATAKK